MTILPADDERVLDGFLLETEHFREATSSEDLHVEDFLDSGLEIDRANDLAGAEVDDGDAAFEFAAPLGQRKRRPSRRWRGSSTVRMNAYGP